MLRKATADDIPAIQRLINANLDKLLPRTDEEILELLESLNAATRSLRIPPPPLPVVRKMLVQMIDLLRSAAIRKASTARFSRS